MLSANASPHHHPVAEQDDSRSYNGTTESDQEPECESTVSSRGYGDDFEEAEDSESNDKQKQRWGTIAQRMKEETMYCTSEHFVDHYLPRIPVSVDFEMIMEHLLEGEYLQQLHMHHDYTLGDISIMPSEAMEEKRTRRSGKAVFVPLLGIVTAIRNAVGASGNPFQLKMVPDQKLKPDTNGCTLHVDACTTASECASGSLRPTDIIVPFQFDIHGDQEQEQKIRLRLVSAIVHIMNEDVRRNFAYGVTIEDDRVSMWYFSRTHSVKAASFSYVKDPKMLVRLFAAFSCATMEQLGYDSRITLLPDMSYLYEFPVTEEDDAATIDYVNREASDSGSAEQSPVGDAKPTPQFLYFRTTKSLSEARILSVAGHTTRVLTAKQVASKEDPTPLEGATDVVLKDVWIGVNTVTEVGIQKELFEDIESFAKTPTGWEQHPLLGEFTSEDTAEMGSWLRDGRYKDLFLCAIRKNLGEGSIVVHADAWYSDEIFKPDLLAGEASSIGSQSIESSPPATTIPTRPVAEGKSPSHRRAFNSKRRCFFLFLDVCTRVSALPTLGAAMDVLRQTHLALMLMFCAGWVHRDISAGNVLAVKKDGETAWHAKLADLEYAQKFPSDDPGSSDSKTGTPYFMAFEIQSSYSLYLEQREPRRRSLEELIIAMKNRPANRVRDDVKKHSYAHDLESLWWLIFWIVTNHIGHRQSYYAASAYFQGGNLSARRHVLEAGWPPIHHPQLAPMRAPFNIVRLALLLGYQNRQPQADIEKLEKYATECASYSYFFTSINHESTRPTWASIALYPAGELVDDADVVDGEQDSSIAAPILKKRKFEEAEDEQVRSKTQPSVLRSERRTTTEAADAPAPSKKVRI